MSPLFSLSKLKNVTGFFDKTAKLVLEHIRRDVRAGKPVDMDDLSGRFAMDCIMRTMFSVDAGAISDPERSEVLKQCQAMPSVYSFVLAAVTPFIMPILNIGIVNKEPRQYVYNFTKHALAERERHPPAEALHDFLELMMKARETDKANSSRLVTSDVIANTFIQFFIDGYDTIGSQVALIFYYLAANPDVQERAREEADRVVQDRLAGDDDKTLNGEDASELTYIDQVFSETCRMGPIPFTTRLCTADYQLPGPGGFTVKKGTKILFPMAGLHYDPEYFPNPETFDPERFSPERKGEIGQGTYMPFGMGARSCLGIRIAKQEAKILTFRVLRNFKIEMYPGVSPSTLEWMPGEFNRVKGGIKLKLVERKLD